MSRTFQKDNLSTEQIIQHMENSTHFMFSC